MKLSGRSNRLSSDVVGAQVPQPPVKMPWSHHFPCDSFPNWEHFPPGALTLPGAPHRQTSMVFSSYG
jgi:hypothetical protein